MSSFIVFFTIVVFIAMIIISTLIYLFIKMYKYIVLPFHKLIIDFLKDTKTWKSFSYYQSYMAKILNKDYRYYEHNKKIKAYQKEFGNTTSHHSSGKRFFLIILFAIFSCAIFYVMIDYGIINFNDTSNTDNTSLIKITNLIIISPILFIIWFFRDQNKLKELHNARKDTNLKEFQKLQQWATGNTEDSDGKNNTALQISALHSLRNYLKGEFGEDFRRGSFEIFASTLARQHKKILDLSITNQTTIQEEIKKDDLTKQINRIIKEEWFNMLINHPFPTSTISLVGVNLQDTYLKHLSYGKQLDLSFANLQGANLWSANLQGANLGSANLQGADLGSAKLQGANLGSANLQGANLGSAKLQGANLGYAKLQGANSDIDMDIGMFNSYIEIIEKQINKKTSLDNISKDILNENDKNNLIQELNALHTVGSDIQSSIKRLEQSESYIDLKGAITGSYTKEEADKWIADFEKNNQEN